MSLKSSRDREQFYHTGSSEGIDITLDGQKMAMLVHKQLSSMFIVRLSSYHIQDLMVPRRRKVTRPICSSTCLRRQTRAYPNTMLNHGTADPMDHLVPRNEPLKLPLSYAAKAGTKDHSYTAVSVSSPEHGEKTLHATETTLWASDSPSKPRLYARLQKQWVDGWAAKMMSCALSAHALACLVATTALFRRKCGDGDAAQDLYQHLSGRTCCGY